jgi:hypothetical protein
LGWWIFNNKMYLRSNVKAQLDGAWLGSIYVITDVTDKESYWNALCIRPGAACDWASEARWISAEAVFSRSSKGLGTGSHCGYPCPCGYLSCAHLWQCGFVCAELSCELLSGHPTRGLQSTRQASLVQVCIHLGRVFVFCCRGARRVKTAGRRRTTRLHDALFHKPSRSVGRASDFTSLDEPRAD